MRTGLRIVLQAAGVVLLTLFVSAVLAVPGLLSDRDSMVPARHVAFVVAR